MHCAVPHSFLLHHASRLIQKDTENELDSPIVGPGGNAVSEQPSAQPGCYGGKVRLSFMCGGVGTGTSPWLFSLNVWWPPPPAQSPALGPQQDFNTSLLALQCRAPIISEEALHEPLAIILALADCYPEHQLAAGGGT